ncbi:hypothetical protein CONCODRAFT_10908 [Conidiobolus coronatus NRRL 28638]|uniref:Ribosomal RNA-processing protein 40 n=1 Tax=Conidiobolus coronatus (strain ATCC 28846 / CBS 209.66 / NRRL 28638) TaxID=796925 RepID=A0A137NW86_CONC2|nr:hypothetical protein CONCODRAFT_10908 [Conidiobolus coronatus NRRL 28638]|eukprot:KXN67090.1 hypothetical protein CONCODRAFT_10908 [Conidiobolus coronatus NRRL 28638]
MSEPQIKKSLPGDILYDPSTLLSEEDPLNKLNFDQVLKLGPGVTYQNDQLVAINAGELMVNQGQNKIWLEFDSKRYKPSVHDPVIGKIVGRQTDHYLVDVGCAFPAMLPHLAFEGATKNNKPNLNVGDLVYGRMTLCHKDMDPEMECYNSDTQKSQGFGPIVGGTLVRGSLGWSRSFLNNPKSILNTIGQQLPFEVAIGVNGKIWIKSDTIQNTLAIKRILLNFEKLDQSEWEEFVKDELVKVKNLD